MKLSKVDQSIAEFYAPTLLAPIKYGENGVFFWFPASGMTTVSRDIFNSKRILAKNIQGLAKRIKILQFWGDTSESKNLKGILNNSGFTDYSELKSISEATLKDGREVVCVIGGMDSFSKAEKVDLLKMFVRLNAINHRRIHIILNLQDKPDFEELLKTNPEFLVLANNLKIMPIITNKLLDSYIKQKSLEYNWKLAQPDIEHIKLVYGGVLQLTKEFLRSKGKIETLELKLRVIWSRLPNAYRELLLNSSKTNSSSIFNDLNNFGVLSLKVFDLHRSSIDLNPTRVLSKLLTDKELKLWNYCLKHTGQTISKDTVIDILRPENAENVSMWALDQAASRFRKKLSKAGIDPEVFKTIKGKGYIWR